jgi:hypothetical protein
MSKRNLIAWSACAAVLALGCAAKKDALREGEAEQAGEDIRGKRSPNEKVTEYDLNRDKRPDVWTYTVPGKDDEGRDVARLVRKELDINWDGKVDITRYYDEREQVVREALDLDFDGKVDQVNHYQRGVVIRKERDLNYDGRTDLWIYYERGKIARKERDISGDGKVDYWEYWEADQIDRIGEDLDGDGTVDRWTKSPRGDR